MGSINIDFFYSTDENTCFYQEEFKGNRVSLKGYKQTHKEKKIQSTPTLENLTFPTHTEKCTHVSTPSLGVRTPTED